LCYCNASAGNVLFFFSSRRRHTRSKRDWSSDVCSSDLYPRGTEMARVAGATEVGAGLSLASGLLTPLGAAGVIGAMTNASVAAHGSAGLWNHNGGYEYPLVLSTIATYLALAGPGSLSADSAMGGRMAGKWWGLGALALGTGSA